MSIHQPSFEPAARRPVQLCRTRPAHVVKAGRHLFRELDSHVGYFEVKRGILRLSRVTRDGDRCVVGFRYPSDIVGFCPDGWHLSDCDVVCDAELIWYRPEAMESGHADPEIRHRLIRAALSESADMQTHLMMLAHRSATARVAAFLEHLGGKVGRVRDGQLHFTLPMPRADIADYLGLTIETISRSLTELRTSGAIAIRNVHDIVLPEPAEGAGAARPRSAA